MVEINFDALVKNAQYIKSKIGSAKLCCVVKCDAYGHGIEQCSRYLQDVADVFAVATVEEAKQIRHLKKDILLLLPLCSKKQLIYANQNNFIITVDSFETLDIIESVSNFFEYPIRVHIKIDSGMSRLGFKFDQLDEVVNLLEKTNCEVVGVYSHFSCSDSDACFSEKQFEYFGECARVLEQKFGALTKHICNTGGVFLNSKYHLDMVRVGLGLYGYGDEGLLPVKTYRSRVLAVKEAKAGSYVSYENSYQCQSDRKLAIIDVGYALGLSRTLSEKITVLVDGIPRQQVGKICMGMCVIDVNDCKISVGDYVEILGNDINPTNGTEYSVYELLCLLK